MGRPPLGERAMTPAEKQRRYRERKFGAVTKPAAKTVKRLEARVRELEAQLAALATETEELIAAAERLRRSKDELRDASRARVHELETELARERKRHGGARPTTAKPKDFRRRIQRAAEANDFIGALLEFFANFSNK